MNIIPWRRKREDRSERVESDQALTRFRGEMETLFDRFFRDPRGSGGLDWPATGPTWPRADLADSEKETTITLELPGVKPEDVEVSIANGVLTVRGEKRDETEKKDRRYQFTERRFGAFQRSIPLPSTVDPNKATAKHHDGVLTVRVAKKADVKAKRITVRDA